MHELAGWSYSISGCNSSDMSSIISLMVFLVLQFLRGRRSTAIGISVFL